MTGGPGLSSGTGAGTGAGGFTGVIRNRSGSMSGVGPGATGDILRGRPVPPLPGYRVATEESPAFGPGVDVTFPNDPYLIPFMAMEEPGAARDRKGTNRRHSGPPEERPLDRDARRAEPGLAADRQRRDRRQPTESGPQDLEEAITATSDVTIPLVRDQRLIAIVTSLNFLTEALLREGNQYCHHGRPPRDAGRQTRSIAQSVATATVLIRMARLEWQRGVYLASIIDNPTYRNEMLYKVAESEASGSATHRQRIHESVGDRLTGRTTVAGRAHRAGQNTGG